MRETAHFQKMDTFLDTIIYNFLLSETERTWSFHSVHFAYFWQKKLFSKRRWISVISNVDTWSATVVGYEEKHIQTRKGV